MICFECVSKASRHRDAMLSREGEKEREGEREKARKDGKRTRFCVLTFLIIVVSMV